MTLLWAAVAVSLAADLPADAPPAREPIAVAGRVSGDVKTFVVGGVPVPWLQVPSEAVPVLEANGLTEDEVLRSAGAAADPYAIGVVAGRLKGELSAGPWYFEAHGLVGVQSTQASGGVGLGTSTGAVLAAPELLPLSWRPDAGPDMSVLLRTDRLSAKLSIPHLDVTLGRQPVSLGSGLFFTPLDLVNPFSPATIDTEYKPGVDALRVDVFAGTTGHLTAVTAWSGSPLLGDDANTDVSLDDAVIAATGGATVGVTDLSGFAGLVRGEPVLGASVVSAIRAVGVHGDVTLTLPDSDEPFVRAVVGADARPTMTTMLAAEVYVQSLGAKEPGEYLDLATSERVASGELWLLGRVYGAVTVSQEINPLLVANVALIGNLTDPSALVAPSLSWSTSQNTELLVGAYVGVGARPDRVDLAIGTDPSTGQPTLLPPSQQDLASSVNSELGLAGSTAFVSMKAYY